MDSTKTNRIWKNFSPSAFQEKNMISFLSLGESEASTTGEGNRRFLSQLYSKKEGFCNNLIIIYFDVYSTSNQANNA